uniref:Uncharacterized protein n=1 Tax=Peronospora matthiolae TaxID=2874970 RepID=A0AAV1TLL2_9STRA
MVDQEGNPKVNSFRVKVRMLKKFKKENQREEEASASCLPLIDRVIDPTR